MKSRPFTKLAIVLIDALRHSSDRFVRSRLDEPWLLLCSCHSDTASERHQNSEESFKTVHAGAVTIDHFCLSQKARASHPCNKQLKMHLHVPRKLVQHPRQVGHMEVQHVYDRAIASVCGWHHLHFQVAAPAVGKEPSVPFARPWSRHGA